MNYLLIDGNNLAIRSAFANEALQSSQGVPTGVHYGFFQSLIYFRHSFPDHQFLIAWDGKSKRRVVEAEEGVEKGIIKSGYKANRKDGEQRQPLLDFYAQAPYLKRAIEQTGIPQIRLPEFEADDVIASYCDKLSLEADTTIVTLTSDKDYYQLLKDNVRMYDGMKQEATTEESFIETYGISPPQHVDCGALMGDTGDNIHGIPGWGEKGALKAIRKHGTWQALYKTLHEEYDSIREEHPDLKGEEFEKLANLRTPKEDEKFYNQEAWKGKYPEITERMPFTGVALAFEEKRWKPKKTSGVKLNLMALIFEERVELAYSLKKMDLDIPNLPDIKQGNCDEQKLLEYFDYYEMESLIEELEAFK